MARNDRPVHRKVVTVVFCDVVGSTALGESIDPEAVRALLARYFEAMDLADVLLAADRIDEAEAAYDQALERYERKRNLAMVAQTRQRLDDVKQAQQPTA